MEDRQIIIDSFFAGDEGQYEDSLEIYTRACLDFAAESCDWLGLPEHKFYTADMWNETWEESCDNASGGVDCRWAFHRDEDTIWEHAEFFYVQEGIALLGLADEEDYDNDQRVRMERQYTGIR